MWVKVARNLVLPMIATVMVFGLPGGGVSAAPSDDGPTVGWKGLKWQEQEKGSRVSPGSEGGNPPVESSDDASPDDTRYEPVCSSIGSCAVVAGCVWTGGDRTGTAYNVVEDDQIMARACLGPSDPEAEPTSTRPVVTPGMVLRAFRRLSWPRSALIVEPPNGRTLVNFETNFLTENTEPTTRSVTLLGTRVTVEATPSSYVFRFEPGASVTTSSPGARYPDLLVTHNYRETGYYSPSVDTIYSGRYRVNNGPWVGLPGTHTVSGESVELQAVEARPKLVPVG